MLSEERWFAVALNAEPWAVGSLGVSHRGKQAYPYMSPNQQLQAYQNALRDELDGAGILTGMVEVKLYIWRRLDVAKVMGGRNRKAKTSDATNIQKATEDAIQGVLIENDRNVQRISTEIVEQNDDCEPCILICVKPYQPLDPATIPDVIWSLVDKTRGEGPMQPTLPWDDPNADPLKDIQDVYRQEGERGQGSTFAPKTEEIF
jgi:Holliday junction resolvase RusA-like endonuclease